MELPIYINRTYPYRNKCHITWENIGPAVKIITYMIISIKGNMNMQHAGELVHFLEKYFRMDLSSPGAGFFSISTSNLFPLEN